MFENIRGFFASGDWFRENQQIEELTDVVESSVPEYDYTGYYSWLEYGISQGYCTNVFCNTHDGYPMAESEEEAWDEGFDPCAFMVRVGPVADWDYPMDDIR